MSDTPRTDKMEKARYYQPIELWYELRKFERELTATLSQRDESNNRLQYVYDQEPNLKEEGMQEFCGYFCHWNEIIKFCADLGIDGYSESPIEMLSRLVDQRDEAREQRDEARRLLGEAKEALTLATNRINRLSLECEHGSSIRGNASEWATDCITKVEQITEYLK